MKNFIRITLLLIHFFLLVDINAQNVISPYLDLQGPLYARENINALNKASNGWIPWAVRNTSLSETKIDLSNILSLNASGGNIGVGLNPINFTSAWTGTPDNNTNVSEISNDVGGYKQLMIVGNKAQGADRRVGIWDKLSINGAGFNQTFNVNGSTYISGNVGIGTSNPLSKLEINGNGANLLNFTNKIIDADYQDMLSVRSASKGSVLNLVSSRADAGPLGGLIFTTTNGWMDSHANIAGIVGGRTGTEAYAGGYLSFWTKNNNGDIPRENMRISHEGNIGIGTILTSNPNSYKLAVNGKIGAKEVQVENTSSTWADYVFEPDYKLMSIKDVEEYIKHNKHLPEVPSKDDVEKNGHRLGEMDVLLLKKVEELTLHLIEANKKLEAQQKQIENLEKAIQQK